VTDVDPRGLDRAALAHFADTRRDAFEAMLEALVEIPSVSAEPARAADVRRCGEAAIALIREHGGEARLVETAGAPIVLGRLAHDTPRAVVSAYNHLDVQPANEPEWRTDPFDLAIDRATGRYVGRGATDDKGPALTALLGARAAIDAGVPIDVRFVWELEEEIGSPSFRAALEAHSADFATESVVVSDTVWLTAGKPSTPAGLRGLQSFSLVLRTADHDLHSGLVGGAARNPLTELAALVGELVDARTGDVKLPGFADGTIPLADDERAEFISSGFTVEQWKQDHQLDKVRTEDRVEVMERIWARPTLEVHGLVGGYQGPGVKSAVPAWGELKLSCRMVPEMRGGRVLDAVRRFLAARAPDVELVPHGCLEPFRGLSRGPLADAIRDAYAFGFGQRAALTREGASIGAVPTMAEVLGVPITFLGLSLPEHGYHAPNERYDWHQARGGIAAFAHYFAALAAGVGRTPGG
jgi:acetylornithine deacetylase/succinyl-diaminopimelate desuccinylase-like protein